jgi:predicted Zn-ribbon and HTH transcriptional regulator
MSDRALLEELLEYVLSNNYKNLFDHFLDVRKKAKEIRTRMATPHPDCETCKYGNRRMQSIPCRECWTKHDGTFPKWERLE